MGDQLVLLGHDARRGNTGAEIDPERGAVGSENANYATERWRRDRAHWSGCGVGRITTGFVALLVPAIILATFIPFVFQNPALSRGALWAWLDLAVFLFLLALLICAWLHTVFVCPGTTPVEWHEMIAQSPDQIRQKYRFCEKTQMYRPPRSHFDSVTRRVVLNMDHYCPWVANTVGFYNRKFFILFLVYTTLATGYAAVSMYLWHDFEVDDAEKGSKLSTLPSFAVLLDTVLCGTMVLFGGFHIKMACFNETSIEPGSNCWGRSRYNVGIRNNVESVFGANPWLWAIPIYGDGPVGDGVVWPTNDDFNGANLNRYGVLTGESALVAARAV